MSPTPANAPRRSLTLQELYALVFGLFLGLAILKFGNPVILDAKITPPVSLSAAWTDAWPTHWANWLLGWLVMSGAWLASKKKVHWSGGWWLWVLPIVWFGWQLVSATQTVDRTLTEATLWQFAGCLACYFLGALVMGPESALRWMLIGVLAAFTFCLVRAANQRLFEFPQERQVLLEGERSGWTNFPPGVVQEMKRDGFIISTNGMEVANPVIMAKYAKGRVHGTLMYPNALAGLVLMLWPLAIALAVNSTRQFRPLTRRVVIALTLLLGGAGLFWTGSKSGWLIALALGGASVFRLNWPKRWKGTALIVMAVVGLTVFAFRFQGYFAAGATSVGARFDYWRAAARITMEYPVFGTGPGTFQRPYARLKSPDAEMARLTHNDYLEQFSDSGIIGGLSYTTWVGLLLVTLGRRVWRSKGALPFAVLVGLLGWGLQGMVEFGLYIPALAWTAFSLLGWLFGGTANPFDNRTTQA
ncbi:MAG: O-antigen ligase family protein [Verrucomicrobia bacterium]|nr:O-antigen ligase family protein [Verrucomicrobiota bacterium]